MKIKIQDSIKDDDFWYNFFAGGYIEPSEILEDQSDIDAVETARQILNVYQEAIKNHNELYGKDCENGGEE